MRKTLAIVTLMLIFAVAGFAQERQKEAVMAPAPPFTYQGKLTVGGSAANGLHDFIIRVYKEPEDGDFEAERVIENVPVVNGIFTLQLDFDTIVFQRLDTAYLDIQVRPAGGEYTPLTPRQQIGSQPYAKIADSAREADSLNCTNCITNGHIASGISGSKISGPVATATNSLQLGGVDANQYVRDGDERLTNERAPTAGSANYIQNSTAQQTSSNFNISGNGQIGGSLGIGTSPTSARLQVNGGDLTAIRGEATGTGFSAGVFGQSGFIGIWGNGGLVGVVGDSPDGVGVGGTGGSSGVSGTSTNGSGVNGQSTTNFGVTGTSTSGIGVRGESELDTGVVGQGDYAGVSGTGEFHGLIGTSTDGIGVRGQSTNNIGVTGTSTNGTGVRGQSTTNVGVNGTSTNGIGVSGSSTNTHGVFGTTSNNGSSSAGVFGSSTNSVGVRGQSTSRGGVEGISQNDPGVSGTSTLSDGVRGTSTTGAGAGVRGIGPLYGVYGQGQFAGYFVGNIYVDGQILGGSDARLKQDIGTLSYGIRDVMRLRPVTWLWKDRPDRGTQLGLIAQEVETVMPELVSTVKSPEKDAEETKGLNYTGLIPVLINAVQEQQTEIETLKAEIEKAKADSAELAKRLATLEKALETLSKEKGN